MYLANYKPRSRSNMAPCAHCIRDRSNIRITIPRRPGQVLSLSSTFSAVLLKLVRPRHLTNVGGLSACRRCSLRTGHTEVMGPILDSCPLRGVVTLGPSLIVTPSCVSTSIVCNLQRVNVTAIIMPAPSAISKIVRGIVRVTRVVKRSRGNDFCGQGVRHRVSRVGRLTRSVPLRRHGAILFMSSVSKCANAKDLFSSVYRCVDVCGTPSQVNLPPQVPFKRRHILTVGPSCVFVPSCGKVSGGLTSECLGGPTFRGLPTVGRGHIGPLPTTCLCAVGRRVNRTVLTVVRAICPRLREGSRS